MSSCAQASKREETEGSRPSFYWIWEYLFLTYFIKLTFKINWKPMRRKHDAASKILSLRGFLMISLTSLGFATLTQKWSQRNDDRAAESGSKLQDSLKREKRDLACGVSEAPSMLLSPRIMSAEEGEVIKISALLHCNFKALAHLSTTFFYGRFPYFHHKQVLLQ